MLNSGFCSRAGGRGGQSGMRGAQRRSPGREMEAGGPALGWGHAARPAQAARGGGGGSCVPMTGRGRPETLTLRGEKPICDLDF